MSETGDTDTDLEELKKRHLDLDKKITALIEDPANDQIKIQRLKKQKLTLKDEISRLEANMLPDIIA